MRHLDEEQIVRVVFAPNAVSRRVDEHLETCDQCRRKVLRLSDAVFAMTNAAGVAAPTFAWARLKSRIQKSNPHRQQVEPRWLPLMVTMGCGVAVVLTLIVLAGDLLETARIWDGMKLFPLVSQLGGRGLMAVLVFGAGALMTVAMLPVLWWESRQPGRDVR